MATISNYLSFFDFFIIIVSSNLKILSYLELGFFFFGSNPCHAAAAGCSSSIRQNILDLIIDNAMHIVYMPCPIMIVCLCFSTGSFVFKNQCTIVIFPQRLGDG